LTVEYTYVPKKVKEGKWEGSVTVRLLGFDEHYDLVQSVSGLDGLQRVKELVKKTAGNWLRVELKRKSDGREFKSFEDLEYGADCHLVRSDVATGLVNGFDDEGNA
jgi:hypothetical protein